LASFQSVVWVQTGPENTGFARVIAPSSSRGSYRAAFKSLPSSVSPAVHCCAPFNIKMPHLTVWKGSAAGCTPRSGTLLLRRNNLAPRCTWTSDTITVSDKSVSGGMRSGPASDGPTQRTAAEVRTATLRAKLFYTISMGLSIPLFFLMSAIFPVVLLVDGYRRRVEHLANKVWAALSTLPFVQVQVTSLAYLCQ
jgi:hypothetical protein